ncbi:sensor histidine kinase [Actinomadura verrucosospora]|uniref:sensor histidine kinase n=1 Tax=Actinomadura verrucosospora TaxID=46165 RepID=UPI001564F14B|nr:HAMP domain-containing sensor histidine kinase [Actinomadura verrucosospora]
MPPVKTVLSRLRRRPILRVQLTLLYSGLVLGLLAAVLLATDLLHGHSAQRAPVGAPAAPATGGRAFDAGPAVIGLVAAVIALAGAWWLAGRFLRPLRAITTTAQEISATNLDRRLDLTGPADELTDLSRTLNDLFGRLQAAFDAQRHFVANASHELRTPLAGQRTLLQVALADPAADTASLRAACEEALQLGDQQERLIEALLTLATGERGVERWDPIDLAEITQGVISGHRREGDRRGVRIDAALAPAPAVGDPRLVTSLIANLLDNAVRHNVAGGRVTVSTTSSAEHAHIAISNTGPPVPHQDLERLFQPFHQAGTERVHRDGHGLGLAIVLAIAEAHGAGLSPHARAEGGLIVEVSFWRKRKP